MKIGITGATGFIGSRVVALCRGGGHETVSFSRRPGAGARLFRLDAPPDLSGLDAIVNLAGEPIFGLWTAEKKRQIRESRVAGTQRIV
ncbi:MAG: NAD-dependent epimerase/dehydratase family protein, partial [Terrimicrobiaceae bacterium]